MPIYEYFCHTCENLFERLQKASDGTPTCPDCGSDQVQKMMSSFSTCITDRGTEQTSHAPELESVGVAINDPSGKGGIVIGLTDRLGPEEFDQVSKIMKKSGRPNETVGILKQVPGTKKVEVN